MTVAPDRMATSIALQRKSKSGAGGVFGRPFDVAGVFARVGDGGADRFEHSVRAHPQLVLHVDGAGGDEGVDARALRLPHRLACPVDVGQRRAGQRTDRHVLHQLGDLADALEIALGGRGEAGLADVDLHVLQEFGQLELFADASSRRRALCSPSRMVVSKITTRSLAAGCAGWLVIGLRVLAWGVSEGLRNGPLDARPAGYAAVTKRAQGLLRSPRRRSVAGRRLWAAGLRMTVSIPPQPLCVKVRGPRRG